MLILPLIEVLSTLFFLASDSKPNAAISLQQNVQYLSDDECFNVATYGSASEYRKNQPHYRHVPQRQTMEENLVNITKAITMFAEQGVDIVLLDEYGLINNDNRTETLEIADDIPDPELEEVSPCDQPEKFLPDSPVVKLSCEAQKYKIYLLMNTIDKKPCTIDDVDVKDFCRLDGYSLFNTNVVFDRSGKIIARYYKTYLFIEKEADSAPGFRPVIFETEFGRMTTLTCFDLIYRESSDIIEEYGIQTVLYSTRWINELPFLTAPIMHQAWAIRNNVNLVAADMQSPLYGSYGSGIYSGRNGAVMSQFVPFYIPNYLMAKIPKRVGEGRICRQPKYTGLINKPADTHVKHSSFMNNFTEYQLKELETSNANETVCHSEFCCHVTYEILDETRSPNWTYYAGVHNGFKYISDKYKWWEQVCFIVACLPNTKHLCQTVDYNATLVFNKLEIEAQFTTDHVFPSVVGTGATLIPTTEWKHFFSKETKTGTISLVKSSTPIISAALYGRDFEKDPVYKHV